ncbi:putative serine/threonine-protein kinase iks1 [Coemansia sp. RSA 2607]|nr:putative serine/threonine-protein kinase iks1 [Coemansia sp. RSA 2607]KAJ2396996.1 putative serine/threonine-protein kinase iks1 [Coemansia sp. RSA 2603]
MDSDYEGSNVSSFVPSIGTGEDENIDDEDKTDIYEDSDAGGVSANSFNQGYYERFFKEQNKLGKGLRGSVFSCQHILDNVYLGHYAVKKVAVGNNHQWLRRMLREVKLLESLRHQNVVEYKHSWLEMHQLTNFGPKVPCLFILMEYANGGNLQEYMEPKSVSITTGDSSMSLKHKILEQRRKSRAGKGLLSPEKPDLATTTDSEGGRRVLSVEQIWSMFADICNGLAHLHQLQIIHRDLKHMNLLLQWKDPDNRETSGEIPRIMLTDFGECEVLSHLEKRDRTGATGTLEFMAPELLKVDSTGRFLDSYSTKSDMWSLGMMLYYLCYTQLPYSDIDDIDALRRDVLKFRHVDFSQVQRPKPSEEIPLELRRIMQRLLNQDEEKRPDINEVVKRVSEHQNLWQSRRRNESRFELHDSDMASNFGGDTPGMQTPPQSRVVDHGRKKDVFSTSMAAHSLALVRSPIQHGLGYLHGNDDIGGGTSAADIFRRHSIDGSSRASSRPQSASGREGDLWKSSMASAEESWSDFKDIADKQGESSKPVATAEQSVKRDVTGGAPAIDDQHISKRLRQEPQSPQLTQHGTTSFQEMDTAFIIKTAVLLAKVYALQRMGEHDSASEYVEGNDQHGKRDISTSRMSVLMGITLILSAVDINQQSSLQTTLVLLAVNILIVYSVGL